MLTIYFSAIDQVNYNTFQRAKNNWIFFPIMQLPQKIDLSVEAAGHGKGDWPQQNCINLTNNYREFIRGKTKKKKGCFWECRISVYFQMQTYAEHDILKHAEELFLGDSLNQFVMDTKYSTFLQPISQEQVSYLPYLVLWIHIPTP